MQYNGFIHKFCTYILQHGFSYRKNVIKANLELAFPGLSSTQYTSIIRKYYGNLAAYLLETMQLFAKPISWFTDKIEYQNTEELKACLEKSSVIILGSHLGNWEWAAVLFPHFAKMPGYAVYKPLSNAGLDRLVKKSRSRFGLGLLNMKEIIRVLGNSHDKSVYFFVSDQSPSDARSGSWQSFLGVSTLFHNGAEVLSKKYNLPVFTQRIIRKNGSAYTVYFERIDTSHITACYVQRLEAEIKENTAAWLWSHRRWKHKIQES